MDNNLIVCVTPLQMLIAERIMEIHPADYTTIIIYYDSNEKYNHYINRIRNKSNDFLSFQVKRDTKASRLFEILKFKLMYLSRIKKRFDSLFVASIDNPFILSILSSTQFRELCTFDDGTANINKGSVYYIDLEIRKFEKFVKRFIGIKWSRDDVIKNSKLHYTLYSKYDNIIKNLHVINLREDDLFHLENTKKYIEIDIFIGQPIESNDGIVSPSLIASVIEQYNVKYYFPHPRERYIIPNVDYIHSELIFEDYIIEMLSKNPLYKVRLYTFHSTVSFNLINISRVEVFCLFNEELYRKYTHIYDLYKKDDRFKFIEV